MKPHRFNVRKIEHRYTQKEGMHWLAIGWNTKLDSKIKQRRISQLRAHRLLKIMERIYGHARTGGTGKNQHWEFQGHSTRVAR